MNIFIHKNQSSSHGILYLVLKQKKKKKIEKEKKSIVRRFIFSHPLKIMKLSLLVEAALLEEDLDLRVV